MNNDDNDKDSVLEQRQPERFTPERLSPLEIEQLREDKRRSLEEVRRAFEKIKRNKVDAETRRGRS